MQARLWACGHGKVSTPSFGSHPNQGRGLILPTIYYYPHQLLKATGAPGIRYRPRFFDQVGHETMSAYIENKYFFTKSCHRQTYQNYEQPPQRL